MAKDDRITNGILGDIEPTPAAREHLPGRGERDFDDPEADLSMSEGSGHNPPGHAGSRDVSDGGGVGVETGGTRNYRSGSGVTGGDLGNRPE
jgi:hypothetical protein